MLSAGLLSTTTMALNSFINANYRFQNLQLLFTFSREPSSSLRRGKLSLKAKFYLSIYLEYLVYIIKVLLLIETYSPMLFAVNTQLPFHRAASSNSVQLKKVFAGLQQAKKRF